MVKQVAPSGYLQNTFFMPWSEIAMGHSVSNHPDFNETWYTCCLGTHSTKSKILGQSDHWCGRYSPPNCESFGKNGRGCQPLNPHNSGTSDPIFIKTGIDGQAI